MPIVRSALVRLLLLGLTPGASLAQNPELPVLPPEAKAGEGVVHPCVVDRVTPPVRCGRFRVWEDGAARRGRTLDIAFLVLGATDSAARTTDAVVPLPGGPGQAFIEAAAGIGQATAALRLTRDVLVVDVRGVGRSGRLACDIEFPGGLQSRFDALFPLDHAAACREYLSRRAGLDRYTTASTVDDLEQLRAWLGYSAVNLVGTSYGTRVAQVYMRRHPGAVRTAVLNGVAAVHQPLYVEHAALLQRALDRLVAECAASEACRGAYPDLDRRLAGLFERFRAGPVAVQVKGQPARFTAGAFAYALRGLLYGRGAELPMMIARAGDGDLSAFAEYYLERVDWVGSANDEAGYHFSVLCAEDIAPLSDAAVDRATQGTFMGSHLIAGYRAVCGLWPYAKMGAEHWRPVRSDIPTLLLSGGRDPVTPPESAEEVARHLTRKVHVVVPNGGHGVGGPCIAAMIQELVRSGGLAGVDTSCVAALPATHFRVP